MRELKKKKKLSTDGRIGGAFFCSTSVTAGENVRRERVLIARIAVSLEFWGEPAS